MNTMLKVLPFNLKVCTFSSKLTASMEFLICYYVDVAARIREMLERVWMAQKSLPSIVYEDIICKAQVAEKLRAETASQDPSRKAHLPEMIICF